MGQVIMVRTTVQEGGEYVALGTRIRVLPIL